jgi:hypothetical protein
VGDTVISAADGTVCRSAVAPAAGGPTGPRHSSTARSPATLVTGSTAPADPTGSPAATSGAATAGPHESGSAPLAPAVPLQLPAPASAVGLAGCGGPGAGEGSPKGSAAPAATGVLGSPFEISLVMNDAAPQAPAAGSPTLTANNPATRPD